MKKLYDKKGIEIQVGDVLKVFHFVAAQRRQRVYMYKWVIGKFKSLTGNEFYKVSHLNNPSNEKEYYHILIDDSIRKDTEIVQGYFGGKSHTERKPNKILKLICPPNTGGGTVHSPLKHGVGALHRHVGGQTAYLSR